MANSKERVPATCPVSGKQREVVGAAKYQHDGHTDLHQTPGSDHRRTRLMLIELTLELSVSVVTL